MIVRVFGVVVDFYSYSEDDDLEKYEDGDELCVVFDLLWVVVEEGEFVGVWIVGDGSGKWEVVMRCFIDLCFWFCCNFYCC